MNGALSWSPGPRAATARWRATSACSPRPCSAGTTGPVTSKMYSP